MGYELLPIEAGEIDEIDPIYDIFEVTGPDKWIPAKFRDSEDIWSKIFILDSICHLATMTCPLMTCRRS